MNCTTFRFNISLPPNEFSRSVDRWRKEADFFKDVPTVKTRNTGNANLPAGAFPMRCLLGPRQCTLIEVKSKPKLWKFLLMDTSFNSIILTMTPT